MQLSERHKRFRQVITSSECVYAASVHDPMSARIAESHGFKVGMLAGSVASMAVLGAPDLIVLTLTEFAEQARRITRASDLPLMVDADHGYGNALNAKRTVEELENAGVSGLTIEDAKLPIAYGSGPGELISIDEMLGKLKAGLAGRRDPSLCVIARSVGVPAEGIAKTVERVKAYATTGVDAVFIVGLTTMEEVAAVHNVLSLPIILGGRSPGMEAQALSENGVHLTLQGHQPFQATIKTLNDVYEHFAKGGSADGIKDKLASNDVIGRFTNKADYDGWLKDHVGFRPGGA